MREGGGEGGAWTWCDARGDVIERRTGVKVDGLRHHASAYHRHTPRACVGVGLRVVVDRAAVHAPLDDHLATLEHIRVGVMPGDCSIGREQHHPHLRHTQCTGNREHLERDVCTWEDAWIVRVGRGSPHHGSARRH